jgi:transcriptional regulator with XRE-family HTH domain
MSRYPYFVAGEVRNDIELGAAVRGARVRAGLTQAELAELAHVSRAFIIKLETGQGPRSELMRVFRVIRALGLVITVGPDTAPSFDEALAQVLKAQER